MSIASNFPAIKPTLLLDFANTEELDPRITFTRASTATYYGTQTAKAEENLLTFSQEFDNAAWVNQSTTETANSTAAPDGTTTAETLDDGVATSGHDIGENFSGTSGTTYTLSAFFKNVDRQYVILACSASTNSWASAKFDLTAGTAGSTSASGAGWSTTSSSITSVGNSWFRCTITFVVGSTGTLTARLGMATDGTTFTAGQRGLESYTGSNKQIYIWGAQLEQGSAVTAYTPTTTQTITNYIPQLLTAASGVARFDHNPTTFESLGLLIEESRTNLVTYSEQFDNAAWTKTATTITANTIVAPDGALTADLAIADTSSALHAVRATYTGTTTTTYSYSVYAKQASGSYEFVIHFGASSGTAAWNSSSRATARFNLLTGVVVSIGATGNSTATSGSIVPVGNGWYRCTFVFVPDTTGASTSFSIGQIAAPVSQSVSVSWSGDGYSGIYIWGAQCEAGAFATSYIPTVASTVTRAADAASMTGTNFSSWFNQAQGSLYVEATPSHTATQYVAIIGDGTTSTLGIGFFIDINLLQARVRGSGASSTIGGGVSITANTAFKIMLSYAAYNNAWAYNGANRSTGNTNIKPENSTTLQIGSAPIGGTNLTGTIKKLSFYPTKLTDAQMNALTS